MKRLLPIIIVGLAFLWLWTCRGTGTPDSHTRRDLPTETPTPAWTWDASSGWDSTVGEDADCTVTDATIYGVNNYCELYTTKYGGISASIYRYTFQMSLSALPPGSDTVHFLDVGLWGTSFKVLPDGRICINYASGECSTSTISAGTEYTVTIEINYATSAYAKVYINNTAWVTDTWTGGGYAQESIGAGFLSGSPWGAGTPQALHIHNMIWEEIDEEPAATNTPTATPTSSLTPTPTPTSTRTGIPSPTNAATARISATQTALATITPPAVNEVMPYQAGNTYCPNGGATVDNHCAYVELTHTGRLELYQWGLEGAGWDYSFPDGSYITTTLALYGNQIAAAQTPIAVSGVLTITNPLGTPAVTAVYTACPIDQAYYVGLGTCGTPSPGR